MTSKKRKSKKYEEYYGEPYTPKTLVQVKVCQKCGRIFTANSRVMQKCPHCHRTLLIKYLPEQKP